MTRNFAGWEGIEMNADFRTKKLSKKKRMLEFPTIASRTSTSKIESL